MKIPAVALNAESGTYWPRLVMPQYRAMQGVKKPAIGTNQCRSNNGYKGGVLSPAFWKVTLNSVPSFYSGIASLCEAIAHEIMLDSEASVWPVLNKGTPAVVADPYHVPPIEASPAIPAFWMNVVPNYDDSYVSFTDGQYGEYIRAIYANYTPYIPQPNRSAVIQTIAGERNPDYVTTTSYGDVVVLSLVAFGTGHLIGDVITFNGGTALYLGGNSFTVLTNTGFELQHEYTQTGSSGSGTGMKVLATCTTGVSDLVLLDRNYTDKKIYGDVCGKWHQAGDVLTFAGGTAQVTATGIQTIYQTTGVLVQSNTSLNVLTDTWESPTTGGWRDGETYDQTNTTGTGTDGKVLATAASFSHFDIVDGGQDFEVGDHVYIYDSGSRYGGFDVATVDGNGAITSIVGTGYCGYSQYRLTFEKTYDQSFVYRDSIPGPSPGTGCQVYMHPNYALTPQPTINIVVTDASYYSCGTNYQVGDIVEFNDASAMVTMIYDEQKILIDDGHGGYYHQWRVVLGDAIAPYIYGFIGGLSLLDATGLVGDTEYDTTGTHGGFENKVAHGSGAAVRAVSPCTIDRAGWPRYNVGVRSMKWDNYGQAQVTPKKLQIAVGLHIPRFSDRYRPVGVWYPDGDVYVAWGIEVEADLWPDVMRLNSLTLPFVGVSRTWYGTYGTGNYGHDGAADWNGTTITLTRTQKPTDNYPGRPYCLFPWALQIT